MRVALYVLLSACVALAWVVARRRAEHRPVAWALSAALAAEFARAALLAYALPPPNPDPSSPPLEGVLRLAVYADRALWIVWPAALAAMSLRVLAGRSAWPVAAGYAIAVAVLIVGYPSLRFGALRQAYLAIELIALAIGVAAASSWYVRGWHRARAGLPARPDLTGRTAAGLVAAHFAMVVTGPYRFELFGQAWAVAHTAYAAILSIVILLHLGEVLVRAKS